MPGEPVLLGRGQGRDVAVPEHLRVAGPRTDDVLVALRLAGPRDASASGSPENPGTPACAGRGRGSPSRPSKYAVNTWS